MERLLLWYVPKDVPDYSEPSVPAHETGKGIHPRALKPCRYTGALHRVAKSLRAFVFAAIPITIAIETAGAQLAGI
jgi:hypothetical protein